MTREIWETIQVILTMVALVVIILVLVDNTPSVTPGSAVRPCTAQPEAALVHPTGEVRRALENIHR